MNRREGVNSFVPCLRRSNSIAPAMPLPVQLPSCPWSYTGGHSDRRSTEGGSPCGKRTRGAPYTKSRSSGRSLTQPYPPWGDGLRTVSFANAPVAPAPDRFIADLLPRAPRRAMSLLLFISAAMPRCCAADLASAGLSSCTETVVLLPSHEHTPCAHCNSVKQVTLSTFRPRKIKRRSEEPSLPGAPLADATPCGGFSQPESEIAALLSAFSCIRRKTQLVRHRL